MEISFIISKRLCRFIILLFLVLLTSSQMFSVAKAMDISPQINKTTISPDLWNEIFSYIDQETLNIIPLISKQNHHNYLDKKKIIFTSKEGVRVFVENAMIAPHYPSYSTIHMDPFLSPEWDLGHNKHNSFLNAAEITQFVATHFALEKLSLVHVNLSHQKKDKRDMALAYRLESNTVLRYLHLQDNLITGTELFRILRALVESHTLEKLHVQNNKIGNDGVNVARDFLEINASLRTLRLVKCGIKDQGAKSIAKALEENTTLTKLVLTDNGITEKGIFAILSSLKKNKTLMFLDLHGNKVPIDELKNIQKIMIMRQKKMGVLQ